MYLHISVASCLSSANTIDIGEKHTVTSLQGTEEVYPMSMANTLLPRSSYEVISVLNIKCLFIGIYIAVEYTKENPKCEGFKDNNIHPPT